MKRANKPKGLKLADVEISGELVSALIDTSASNLFIFKEGAKILGLWLEKTNALVEVFGKLKGA